jgi:hypothetical protein
MPELTASVPLVHDLVSCSRFDISLTRSLSLSWGIMENHFCPAGGLDASSIHSDYASKPHAVDPCPYRFRVRSRRVDRWRLAADLTSRLGPFPGDRCQL